MINFGPFEFAGAPRSGTTWILKATAAVGLGEFSKSRIHVPHVVPKKGHAATLKVSTVRHPCDWLASYYGAIQGGHTDVAEVDVLIPLMTPEIVPFRVFIESYLNRMPGQVSKMFTAYRADSYIKAEEFPWSYIELVVAAGVSPEQAKKCVDIPRQNACSSLPVFDRRLRRRVMEAEKQMIEAFDYH